MSRKLFSLMVMKPRLFVELGLRFSFALLVLLTVRRHVEKLNFDTYSQGFRWKSERSVLRFLLLGHVGVANHLIILFRFINFIHTSPRGLVKYSISYMHREELVQSSDLRLKV